MSRPSVATVLRPLACSQRQHDFIMAIALLQKASGFSPSYRELGVAVGYAGVGGVDWMIKRLVAAGALTQGLNLDGQRAERSIKLSPRLCLVKSPEGYRVYEKIGELK